MVARVDRALKDDLGIADGVERVDANGTGQLLLGHATMLTVHPDGFLPPPEGDPPPR